MIVIKPTPITPSMLVSSTAGEPSPGETLYNAGSTYALGARVIRTTTHKVYESLQAANTGNTPESSPTWWVEVGANNRWAMFDQAVGTRTVADGALTVVLQPGQINALALLELLGTTALVTLTVGGDVVYSVEASLDGTIIGDWYAYFFEPYQQLETLVLTGLPPYPGGVLEVSIIADGQAGTGALVVGNGYDIGALTAGVTASITDYSRKERNDFGIFEIVERGFSKRMEGQLFLENSAVNRVYSTLAALRATPAIYIGSDDPRFSTPLVIYGFFRDFGINIAYPEHSLCSIEIEGLV